MKVKYITNLAANLKGKIIQHRGKKDKALSKRAGRYQKGQGVTKKGRASIKRGRALRQSSLL
jgi:hypothetical protein